VSRCLPPIEQFRRQLEVTKSPHTATAYVQDVRDLERHLGKRGKFLLTATGKDLLEYMSESEGRLSDNSRARRVSGIRKFYRFAVRAELVTADPSRLLMVRKKKLAPLAVPSARRIFTLLETPPASSPCGARDRAILELLYGAGLRVSELTGMNLASVDWKERILRVMGKGGRERLCPINRTALQVLQSYLDRRGEFRKKKLKPHPQALFLNQFGRRITAHTVFLLVRHWAVTSGLSSKVTPHTLRHTFATHLMRAGAKVDDVRMLMGHNRIRTTQRYLHVELEDLQRAYRKAHPRALSSPPARSIAPCGAARCDELLELPEKRRRVKPPPPTWVATHCQRAAL